MTSPVNPLMPFSVVFSIYQAGMTALEPLNTKLPPGVNTITITSNHPINVYDVPNYVWAQRRKIGAVVPDASGVGRGVFAIPVGVSEITSLRLEGQNSTFPVPLKIGAQIINTPLG